MTSSTASVRLGRFVPRSIDFAHHESAITNKKIPFLPPLRNLAHWALGNDSRLNGHDGVARPGGWQPPHQPVQASMYTVMSETDTCASVWLVSHSSISGGRPFDGRRVFCATAQSAITIQHRGCETHILRRGSNLKFEIEFNKVQPPADIGDTEEVLYNLRRYEFWAGRHQR